MVDFHLIAILHTLGRECHMFSNIGMPGLIVILIIALMIFGPAKLPQIGRAVGDSLREFKKATKDIVKDDIEKVSDEVKSDKTP